MSEDGMTNPDGANDIIEQQLCDRLRAIEQITKTDVVLYAGPIREPANDLLKMAVEALADLAPKRRTLTVLLETNGGYIEVAETMVRVMRHHYRQVDFVVPSQAMSAGTVLALSGDNIFMDYASSLGPIDPQIQSKGSGNFIPALGYLEQYERLVEKSHNNELSTVEVAWFLNYFDPGEISHYEHARDLSIALLEEWLTNYKFKKWKKTETRGLTVNKAMRRERAKQIAQKLNDTSKWHSHGRGISMQVLRRDLKLEVTDLESEVEMNEVIQSYWKLLSDYRARVGHFTINMNWRNRYVGF